MSLSAQDEEQLLQWFVEKEKHPDKGDDYFKYRDLVFTYVLKNLDDYFTTLKTTWRKKYHISDDDCISIVHDGLLAAVENFEVAHKSKERLVKFTTYLTTVLTNLAKDYARRNHVRFEQKGLMKTPKNMTKIPSSLYVSLDYLMDVAKQQNGNYENSSQLDKKLVKPLLTILLEQEKDQEFSQKLIDKVSIYDIIQRLATTDRYIMEAIIKGDHLSEIAKTLGLTTPGIRYRLRRLAKKFQDLKQGLWELEKPS